MDSLHQKGAVGSETFWACRDLPKATAMPSAGDDWLSVIGTNEALLAALIISAP